MSKQYDDYVAGLIGKVAISPGRVVRLMAPQAGNVEPSGDEMWVLSLDGKGKVVGAKCLTILTCGLDWFQPQVIVAEAAALGGVSFWVCLLQSGGRFQLTYDDHCRPEQIQAEAKKRGLWFRNYTRISETHYINVQDYYSHYFQ